MQRAHRWLTRWAKDVGTWEFWTLPHWLGAVVVFAVICDLAAIAASAMTVHLQVRDVALFALLLGCIAVTDELTRHVGENKGLIKDVYGAWALPAAILLPPIYILTMTVMHYSFLQWRGRENAVFKRAYSAAEVGLSFAAAGLTFRWIYHSVIPAQPGDVIHSLVWCLALIMAVLVHTVINKTFMMLALRGSDPLVDIRGTFFAREPLYN